MAHKVTVKLSLSYSDTVVARCSCGWYEMASKTKFYTNSMRTVRRELRYLVLDHIEEAKTTEVAA